MSIKTFNGYDNYIPGWVSQKTMNQDEELKSELNEERKKRIRGRGRASAKNSGYSRSCT